MLCYCAADLSRHGSSQKDEVATLQNTIASLDREKDALQDDVDQKTESVVLLQEEIHRKVLLTLSTQYEGMSYYSAVVNTECLVIFVEKITSCIQ